MPPEVKIKGFRLFLADSMPGVVPQLPLELVDAIISHATLPTLLALRRANSTCRDIAHKWLYRSLLLGNVVTTIKCFKALCKKPEMAKHVYRVAIIISSPDTSPFHYSNTSSYLSSAFGTLLQDGFLNMKNVKFLRLDIDAPLGRYLRGSPFRAVDIDLKCRWDAQLAEWLEEQSSVRSFSFDRSLGEQPIVLKPTALPFLERVIGAPPVIEGLVPGRPVKEVIMLLFVAGLDCEDPELGATMRSCALSTGPIRAFHVNYDHAYVEPKDSMLFLRPIPRLLPDITKFSLSISGPNHSDLVRRLNLSSQAYSGD